jgi:hypothetical protein
MRLVTPSQLVTVVVDQEQVFVVEMVDRQLLVHYRLP